MAMFNRPLHHLGLLFTGLGNSVESVFHSILVEEAKQAPKPSAAAILILALGRVVAFVDPRRAYGEFAESRLGDAVASEDARFSSLLMCEVSFRKKAIRALVSE